MPRMCLCLAVPLLCQAQSCVPESYIHILFYREHKSLDVFKNLDTKLFTFCIAFRWGRRGPPSALASPCLALCESLRTPDGHSPWGMLKPSWFGSALLKFRWFFCASLFPIGCGCVHEFRAGCDWEWVFLEDAAEYGTPFMGQQAGQPSREAGLIPL